MSLSNDFKDDEIKKRNTVVVRIKKETHFYFYRIWVQDSIAPTSYQNGIQLSHMLTTSSFSREMPFKPPSVEMYISFMVLSITLSPFPIFVIFFSNQAIF